ncbi:MAG: hypothetical protein D6761_13350 [Candidatus Dadabacteria bacterium]|nr:MAG: hypothetical protein D6761_13350 [Candidatus Dadabacteria bacterium]
MLGRCPLPPVDTNDPVAALFDGRIMPLLSQAGRMDWADRLRQVRAGLSAHAFPGGPSMTHGDFWGGNHGADARDRLVVFDPAPMRAGLWWDLGFLQAFSPASAAAVREVLTRQYGYPADSARIAEWLAELTIMLAHVVMFGGGYAAQVERIVSRLEQQ